MRVKNNFSIQWRGFSLFISGFTTPSKRLRLDENRTSVTFSVIRIDKSIITTPRKDGSGKFTQFFHGLGIRQGKKVRFTSWFPQLHKSLISIKGELLKAITINNVKYDDTATCIIDTYSTLGEIITLSEAYSYPTPVPTPIESVIVSSPMHS